MMDCVIGMDVGGTNIRLGAVNEKGELFYERSTSSRNVEGNDAGKKLLKILKEYCGSLRNVNIRAVSVSFPGILNRERTKTLSIPNVEGLSGVEFGETYSKVIGAPVWGDNDACMLMYYDMKVNQIPMEGMTIGIYVGTGLANVFMLNGEPYLGKNGVAGELSHIPVIGKEELCGCGLKGCLELYAAGKGLERICAKHYPGEFIGDIFKIHGEEAPLQEYVKMLAQAIAIEITLLDPDYLCLGGGVLNMERFPLEQLAELVKKYARQPLPAENLKIIFSRQSGAYNGVIGSGLYGWHRLKKQ